MPNVLYPSSPPASSSSGVDVLIHPSAIRTAPLLRSPDDSSDMVNNELGAYLQDVLTVPASLSGLPAISIPSGEGEDGWPVGISVVAQWGCESVLFDVGKAIEVI